jgi:hypothetical protein
MCSTVDDYITNHKESLHEDIVTSKELATRERESMLMQATKETMDERMQRLVAENEFRGNIAASKVYMMDRVVLQPRNQ